ncbi:MAG: carboxypeptidase-like regulatory domain-containing protein, partial [Ferruginibacter sp.]
MKKLCLSLSLILSSYLLFAQQSYTITVSDSRTGNPVADVSVKIRSTNKGGITNANGTVALQASASDVVEISSIGYTSKQITLGAQTNINVSLESTSIEYIDVVLIGTRGAPRAKVETAVPVDVIRINQVGLPT